MKDLKDDVPLGFDHPTALPSDSAQQQRWQAANRSWWQQHPMNYDWNEAIPYPKFSREFYEEIDRRFFSDAAEYLPWKEIPFDPLIDFERLRNQDVLEIGVGNGSHAALLARHARTFTGIDLTDNAVQSTTARFHCAGLEGRILRMDAEQMEFADNSFDFIWTWGVIHHSANIHRILSEMRRVLRPGGQATVMVYHRNFLNYYVMAGFFHGILRGGLWKYGSLHKTMQLRSDGAIARYYRPAEWNRLAAEFFEVEDLGVCGSKMQLLPLPAGRFKNAVRSAIPNALGRCFTRSCGLGEFLLSRLTVRTPK